jgi:hypothetical protein
VDRESLGIDSCFISQLWRQTSFDRDGEKYVNYPWQPHLSILQSYTLHGHGTRAVRRSILLMWRVTAAETEARDFDKSIKRPEVSERSTILNQLPSLRLVHLTGDFLETPSYPTSVSTSHFAGFVVHKVLSLALGTISAGYLLRFPSMLMEDRAQLNRAASVLISLSHRYGL